MLQPGNETASPKLYPSAVGLLPDQVNGIDRKGPGPAESVPDPARLLFHVEDVDLRNRVRQRDVRPVCKCLCTRQYRSLEYVVKLVRLLRSFSDSQIEDIGRREPDNLSQFNAKRSQLDQAICNCLGGQLRLDCQQSRRKERKVRTVCLLTGKRRSHAVKVFTERARNVGDNGMRLRDSSRTRDAHVSATWKPAELRHFRARRHPPLQARALRRVSWAPEPTTEPHRNLYISQ
jgi:hypothetical protein